MNIPLPPDVAARLLMLAHEQKRDPVDMVVDNLRVSMRDYERQRLRPQPQRSSLTIVQPANIAGRKVSGTPW